MVGIEKRRRPAAMSAAVPPGAAGGRVAPSQQGRADLRRAVGEPRLRAGRCPPLLRHVHLEGILDRARHQHRTLGAGSPARASATPTTSCWLQALEAILERSQYRGPRRGCGSRRSAAAATRSGMTTSTPDARFTSPAPGSPGRPPVGGRAPSLPAPPSLLYSVFVPSPPLLRASLPCSCPPSSPPLPPPSSLPTSAPSSPPPRLPAPSPVPPVLTPPPLRLPLSPSLRAPPSLSPLLARPPPPPRGVEAANRPLRTTARGRPAAG